MVFSGSSEERKKNKIEEHSDQFTERGLHNQSGIVGRDMAFPRDENTHRLTSNQGVKRDA
jgi:hypothetical protein